MTEVPELWWSKSAAEARGNVAGGVLARGHDGRPEHALPPYESELLDAWPADVVPFVPAESRVECPRCRLLRWTVDGVMAHHEAWVGQACPGVGMKPERPVELEARVDPAAERAAEPLLAEQAEQVDEKSRGPSYWRGFSDGRLAERAGAPADGVLGGDTRGVLALAGLSEDEIDVVAAYYAKVHADDAPPFAPELADAPLVSGESGAPAPLVVDQPVHDSTLPAEVSRRGPLRDFPSDRDTDEGTHYPGDGCQPPHPDFARDFGR